jgi:hypothetical protein
MRPPCVAFVLVATMCAVRGETSDPAAEAEVVAAVHALQTAKSYSWDTAFGSVSVPPRRGTRNDGTMRTRRDLAVVREIGQVGDGMSLVTLPATEKGPAQLAAWRGRKIAIAETADGWLTSAEISRVRASSVATDMVEFKGRKMFKVDALSRASGALRTEAPDTQLVPLVNDIESFRREGSYILGKLSETGHRRRNGGRVRPGEETYLVFWIVHGEIREYMITTIMLDAAGRMALPASYSGQVVRIFDVGNTVPMIPSEGLQVLLR